MHSNHSAAGLAAILALAAPAAAQVNHDDVALHPGYTLTEAHPAAWTPQVSDMDFMADGKVVILTHLPALENVSGTPKKVGTLNIVTNITAATPEEITYVQVAQELMEPMGVEVVNGKIYVAEKTQLTEFTLSADGRSATARKVADIPNDAEGEVNFQEYPFGLLHKDGFFYTAVSAAVRRGGVSFNTNPEKLTEPKRGGILKINAATGTSELLNGGLRAPNGLAWGPEGSIWTTDNQGSWLPSSKIIHVVPGRNYGYFNGPNGYQGKAETWPAIWVPYGDFARSPTHPTLVQKGPYAGQFLMGDVASGGLYRAFFEKVGGEYQGAVFSVTGGLSCGMQKLLELPDGSFILGGLGRGDAANWGWKAKKQGLQRIIPKAGFAGFEMLAVRARKDGMEIEFTKPAGAEALVASNWVVVSHTMAGTALYANSGLNMANKKPLAVAAVTQSADKKSVFLSVPGLEAKTVLLIQGKALKSEAGEDLFRPTTYYTLTSLAASAPFSGANAIARLPGNRAAELSVGRIATGLSVGVPFAGPHLLKIRDLGGRVLQVLSGEGARSHILAPSALGRGVFLLEVTAGSDRAVRTVAM